jgi:hypothetical protein
VDGSHANACLHQFAGMWPVPELSRDETLALMAVIADYDVDEFREAADLLSRVTRNMRPAPVELRTALRGVRQRRIDNQPALPQAPPAANPLGWVAKSRVALRDALRRAGENRRPDPDRPR